MTVQCEQCGARYKIDPGRLSKKGLRVRCSRCKHVFIISAPDRPCILVAKDGKDFCLSVQELLEGEPFDVIFAADGVEALEKIREHRPRLAILDVSLPKIFGFELSEMLRADPLTRDMRILLLAVIYDRTKYKRLPESLYGADDYIEAHHVMDRLLTKIRALLPDLFQKPVEQKKMAGGLSQEPASDKETLSDDTQCRAARLARIIISDIALYNQKKIEEGIRTGDLEERMAPELEEGETMMQKRFPGLPSDQYRILLQKEIQALMEKNRIVPKAI